MMINELPRNMMDIATTYFEDPKVQSQFKKDMDNNMKMLSGLDSVVTDQELSDQINSENNALIDNGTAEAMLERNDRESLEMLTQNMYQMGVMSRTNPDIAAADYYTQNEMANEAAVNDMYRINLTNSKRDPRLYSTKSTIAYEKIAEAADGLQPNYVRNTVRYLGQPALAIGMTVGGGKIGAGLTDAVMAGWDYSVLGDTIYNTQEYYNNKYLDIINNDSLSLEQFNEEMSNFVKDIQINVAPEYQFEIFNSILEGPDPFADAGLAFTSGGVQTYLMPFGFLAKLAKRALPFKRSNSLKRMIMNQELSEKIKKSITNTVDEAAVDESIATKVAEVAPKDASQTDVDTVKGIMKNDINDSKLLSNSNNDTSFFNRFLRGLAGADEKTGSNQRGEIRLEEPDQSYYIDHGKGVDNDPMTLEEAMKLKKQLQSNAVVNVDKNYTSEELPDYVAFSSASVRPWGQDDEGVIRPYLSKETARTGAGGMSFHYGIYGSTVAGNELSRKYYLRNVHYQEAMRNAFKSFMSDDMIDKMTKETLKYTDELDHQAALRSQKDLERVFMDLEGYDLSAYITQIKSKLKKATSNFDKTYYSEMLTGLKEISKVDRKNIPVFLNTFTGKNPIKYPYKYIFDDEGSEPYVLKSRPENFKELPLENQNKYKEVDEKFNKWKQDIKNAVYEKYPEKFEIVGQTGMVDRDSWNNILDIYVRDILNVKESTESWLRSELNKMGFSAWLHMHHDNAMNVVTINDKDFSAITSMEIFKNNFTDLEQNLWDNGFGIVSAGDGVGYFVRELHGVKGAKPMIVKNYKVVDFGDYKEYNNKK